MSFQWICFVMFSVCKLWDVFSSLSQESCRTPRLRTSLATPRRGKRPRGSYRSGSAGRTRWRCHRRSSTWPSLWCCRRCPGWGGRCGTPEDRSWPPLLYNDLSHLTAAVHVSIVTVSLALAGEGVAVGVGEDLLMSSRELVSVLLGEDQSSRHQTAHSQSQHWGHSAMLSLYFTSRERPSPVPCLLSLLALADHWRWWNAGNTFIGDTRHWVWWDYSGPTNTHIFTQTSHTQHLHSVLSSGSITISLKCQYKCHYSVKLL